MQLNPLDGLPAIRFPTLERELPGGIRTFIHAMSFQDASWVRRMGLHYTGQKQNRTDYQSLVPDDDILKILQMVVVCKTGPQDPEPTFVIPMGTEVCCIDKITEWLPGPIVQAICYESDSLSMHGYIPVETAEQKGEKEAARKRLLEVLGEPATWEHLNYLSVQVFGKELGEVNDRSIGEALNLLKRHDEVQNGLLEAMMMFMTAMSGGAA